MKRMALILAALLVFSTTPLVKSASIPDASLSIITLGLKDSIVFGNYEIKFADVNAGWTQAYLEIYKNGKRVASGVLSEEQTLSYPQTDPNIKVTLKYIQSYEKRIWVEVSSPLHALEENLSLREGKSYTFPQWLPNIRIKLVTAYETKAKFYIYLPYTTKPIEKIIDENEGSAISYQLTKDVSYYRYVYIVVKDSVEGKSAKIDIYVPKYPSTSLTIKRVTTEEKPEEAPLEPEELVYNDIMYVGEILTLTHNTTVYRIRLNSIGLYSSISIFKGTTPLETVTIKEGKSYTSKKAPLRVEIPPNSVDLTYNRTYLKVYAPSGTEVTPIIRKADIKVSLSTNVKKMLLDGDELIVFVNIKNEGRGKAFDLNVIAPLPNNFELRSGIGTWVLKTLDAFSEMPVLVYTLKPTQVGSFDLGAVKVKYYDEAGKENSVSSNTVKGIIVYGVPEISVAGEAFNGTWSNYIATQDKMIKLRFKVTASNGNPDYEFIQNATLELLLPESIDGESKLTIGTIKAGEEKVIESQYLILKQDVSVIGAKLKYQDPLGNWHEKDFTNLLLINSIPPKVIVEEKIIEKWPKPEELPSYLDKTLSSLDENTRLKLAESISNISSKYLPPKSDYKTPLLVVLFILVAALGATTINYKTKYETVRQKLERRRKRKGGLPKKEEEEKEEIIQETTEVEKTEIESF